MIFYKTWKSYEHYRIKYVYEGWFLFGILPLYIKRLG
jgi:hypothetical protein